MAAESPADNSSLSHRLQLALRQYESGQYAQALDELRVLSDMLPANSEIQLNLANVYFKLEDDSQAEVHWKKAIELDPMEGSAYLNLGNLYFKRNRLEDALQQWETCKRINKQNPSLWLNLGVAYERLQEPDKAMDHYSVYLGLQKSGTEAAKLMQRFDAMRKQFEERVKAGENALTTGDTASAKKLLGKALATYPGTARMYKTYASLLYQDGELEPALKYYLRALEANPEDVGVIINLGVIYERIGQPIDAVWAYFKASRLSSTEKDKVTRRFEGMLAKYKSGFPDYLHAAQTLVRQGRLRQAQVRLERLGELDVYLETLRGEVKEWREKVEDMTDPTARAARTYYARGEDARNNGRFDQALTFYQKYLALKPNGPEAEKIRAQLGEIKTIIGAVVGTMLDQEKQK